MTDFGWWQRLAVMGGSFICSECMNVFPLEEAWTDADGEFWDICRGCWESLPTIPASAPGDLHVVPLQPGMSFTVEDAGFTVTNDTGEPQSVAWIHREPWPG